MRARLFVISSRLLTQCVCMLFLLLCILFFFFFNDPATTEIYTFPYTTLFRSSSRWRVNEAVHMGLDARNDASARRAGARGHGRGTAERRRGAATAEADPPTLERARAHDAGAER